jgi:hypothetical protein
MDSFVSASSAKRLRSPRGSMRRAASSLSCSQCYRTPSELLREVFGERGAHARSSLGLSLGADYTIDYGAADWVQQVKEVTRGRGVDVVYDSVGRDTCAASLDCLKSRGRRPRIAISRRGAPAAPSCSLFERPQGGDRRSACLCLGVLHSDASWRDHDRFLWNQPVPASKGPRRLEGLLDRGYEPH